MQEEMELLKKGLLELSIEPKNELIERFIIFLLELKKWNRVYNLTTIIKNEDIIIKHFFDSLLYLKLIPEGGWEICDIGSGGGFPGIPVALIRFESQITLIESSKKKSLFLNHIRRILSLNNVKILNLRVEDVKDHLFDIAMVRALFKIYELNQKTSHILRPSGFYIISKGTSFKEEFEKSPFDLRYEVFQMKLPFTNITRNLIRILK